MPIQDQFNQIGDMISACDLLNQNESINSVFTQLRSTESQEERLVFIDDLVGQLELLLHDHESSPIQQMILKLLLLANEIRENLEGHLPRNLSMSEKALRDEQTLIHQHRSFQSFFKSVGDYFQPRFQQPTCFISYAWASVNQIHELWTQNFLLLLTKHLKMMGIDARIDQRDSRYGQNMRAYMAGLSNSHFVLFFGSRSLHEKLSDQRVRRNVRHEYDLIRSRQIEINHSQGLPGRHPVIPILMSGTCEESFGDFCMPNRMMPESPGIEEWVKADGFYRDRKSYFVSLMKLVKHVYKFYLPESEKENFKQFLSQKIAAFENECSATYLVNGFNEEELSRFLLTKTPVEKIKSVHQRHVHELQKQLDLRCYIDSRVKVSLQSDESEPLLQILPRFLSHEEQQVLLLQGDSGSGKTLSSIVLENHFWEQYKIDGVNGYIPIRVSLKEIPSAQLEEIIPYVLQQFSPFSLVLTTMLFLHQ